MSQPAWKFLENFGDVNPLDYGGLFLYVDRTGVYPAELEKLEPTEETYADGDGEETPRYRVHRVTLDRCTFVDGVLSSNESHPELAAWFADKLGSIASAIGGSRDELIAELCSEDPTARAHAWQAIYDVEGWANGDQYSLTLTRAEAEARYRDGELDGR